MVFVPIIGDVGSLIEVSKAVNTDWFGSNLGLLTAHGGPVKHTIQIRLATTDSVVKIELDEGTDTDIEMLLNSGNVLVAKALYIFDLILLIGQTYNIQHETATQNVFCSIIESRNVDI